MSQHPPPQVYSKITALLPVICKTLLLWFMNHIHQFPHDTLLPLHTASLNRFKWIILGVWIVLSLSAVHKTVVPQTHSCQKYNTPPQTLMTHTFPITPCRLRREQLLRTPSKCAKLIKLNELCAHNTAMHAGKETPQRHIQCSVWHCLLESFHQNVLVNFIMSYSLRFALNKLAYIYIYIYIYTVYFVFLPKTVRALKY